MSLDSFQKKSETSVGPINVLPAFVSAHIREYCDQLIEESEQNGTEIVMKPMAREAFAAVVMVDVSGYSKLSAALAEYGPSGSELLAKTMKAYLDLVNSFH